MLDVIIIGGGVVGCAVARELSRYRAEILLLEKTDDICNGQSKANTAIVHGGYDALPGTNKAKYNVLGNRLFPDVCAELDVPFQRNTSLVVSFSPDGHGKLEELLARGRANGVQGLSLLSRDELHRREPHLNADACEALLVEPGGICCPYGLTQAYAENAARNGVRFLRNACVTGICRADDGVNWRVSSSAGTFLVGHHTINNVHESVPAAVVGTTEVSKVASLGVIETISALTAVQAGDIAAKASNITLMEIRIARGMGGKGFLIFTGEVSAVRSAVKACISGLESSGEIISHCVIPSPHADP